MKVATQEVPLSIDDPNKLTTETNVSLIKDEAIVEEIMEKPVQKKERELDRFTFD